MLIVLGKGHPPYGNDPLLTDMNSVLSAEGDLKHNPALFDYSTLAFTFSGN